MPAFQNSSTAESDATEFTCGLAQADSCQTDAFHRQTLAGDTSLSEAEAATGCVSLHSTKAFLGKHMACHPYRQVFAGGVSLQSE